jgi:hypothetical protein
MDEYNSCYSRSLGGAYDAGSQSFAKMANNDP